VEKVKPLDELDRLTDPSSQQGDNGSPVTTEDYSIGNDNTTASMGAKLGKKRNAPPGLGVLTANPTGTANGQTTPLNDDIFGGKSNTDILNTQEVTRK
jgi:hypothetical protein